MSLLKTCVGVVAVTAAMVGCGSDPEVMGSGSGGAAGFSGAGAGGTAGVAGTGGTAGVVAGTGGTAGVVAGTGGVGGGAQTLEQLFPNVTEWNALEIVYPTMYSAYDGVHSFKVPVRVKCTAVPLANWHAEPADAVTFDTDPDNANGVMVTIVRPVENIRIAAIEGSRAGIAPLIVTIGTPEQWALGEQRYNNGADWSLDILNPTAPPPDTKCTVCHGANSQTDFDIAHTPTQAARISDAALTQIMTTGTKPADVDFRVLPPTITFGLMTFTNAELYVMFHLWDTTAEPLKGMILYLRSLTPAGQGCVMNPDTGVCEDVTSGTDECNP